MKVKKNNRFNSIFSTLSETERKEFCEFLRLTFVKKPRLSGIVIDKIELGDDLHSYLESKYSERSLWNIYFELTRSIKQFIAIKEIIDNEEKMHDLQQLQFRKRGLGDLLIADHKKNIDKLKSNGFSELTLKEIHDSSENCVMEMAKYGLSKDLSKMMKTSSDHFILRFYYDLVLNLIEKQLRKEFYGDIENFLMLELTLHSDLSKIFGIISERYPEYEVFFGINLNLYAAITEPDNLRYFIKAKKLFMSNISRLSANLRSDTYYTLLNVAIFISKKSKNNLDREMFDIMRSKLDNGITDDLKKIKIGENHFRDYVYIAVNLNEDKWAEEFINKYSSLLPEELRENNVNTSLAFLNLNRKRYSEAIRYIMNLKRSFHIHDFDYYTIQIFAHYESGNIVDCLRVKKRFQEYLKNNSQLPKFDKTGSENFLKLLTELIKYRDTGKKKILDDLKYAVVNTDELFWRKWISKMLEEANVRF